MLQRRNAETDRLVRRGRHRGRELRPAGLRAADGRDHGRDDLRRGRLARRRRRARRPRRHRPVLPRRAADRARRARRAAPGRGPPRRLARPARAGVERAPAGGHERDRGKPRPRPRAIERRGGRPRCSTPRPSPRSTRCSTPRASRRAEPALEPGRTRQAERSTWRMRRTMPSSSFSVTCGSSSSSAMRWRRNSRSTTQRGHGHDRGAAGLRVDRRELAEEVAGQHGADLLPLAHDLALALEHDEQRLAGLALAHHRLAGSEGELVGVARQPLQVPLGEVGEQRHAGERRRRLTLRARDRLLGLARRWASSADSRRHRSGKLWLMRGSLPRSAASGANGPSDRGRCRRSPLG